MNSLRHLLLIAVLVFAQLAVGAHAVEHAAGKEGALPTHTCELCLAAHDLGAALPSVPLLLAPALPAPAPEVRVVRGRAALPPPPACQRGPPLA